MKMFPRVFVVVDVISHVTSAARTHGPHVLTDQQTVKADVILESLKAAAMYTLL